MLGEWKRKQGVWAMTLLLGKTGGPVSLGKMAKSPLPLRKGPVPRACLHATDVPWGSECDRSASRREQRDPGPAEPPQLLGCVTLS